MHLSWLGRTAFKVETKDAVIVTDPYAPAYAPHPLRVKADVVTVSVPGSEDFGYLRGVMGDPFVLDHPGEFEVRGVYIEGISAAAQNSHEVEGPPFPKGGRGASSARAPVLYTFDLENLRLAHLGGIHTLPSDAVLERLDGVDILFLPVGGHVTLEPETAMKAVNALEPRMVIPMLFHQEGWKTPEKLMPVSAFLREIGSSKVEPVERLTVKQRDLTGEETRVVVFQT